MCRSYARRKGKKFAIIDFRYVFYRVQCFPGKLLSMVFEALCIQSASSSLLSCLSTPLVIRQNNSIGVSLIYSVSVIKQNKRTHFNGGGGNTIYSQLAHNIIMNTVVAVLELGKSKKKSRSAYNIV